MNIKLASFISTQCASIDDGQVFFKQVYPEIKKGKPTGLSQSPYLICFLGYNFNESKKLCTLSFCLKR